MKHRTRTPPRRSTGGHHNAPSTIPHGGGGSTTNSPNPAEKTSTTDATTTTATAAERRRQQARRMKFKQSDSSFASLSSSSSNSNFEKDAQKRRYQSQHTYNNNNNPRHQCKKYIFLAASILLFVFVGWYYKNNQTGNTTSDIFTTQTRKEDVIFVFSSYEEEVEASRESKRALNLFRTMITSSSKVQFKTFTSKERSSFLSSYGTQCYDSENNNNNVVLERYQGLKDEALKIELWKYCMLYLGYGQVFVDAENVMLLSTFQDAFLSQQQKEEEGEGFRRNVAILIDSSYHHYEEEEQQMMIHSSFLFISTVKSSVPKKMIQLIVETSNEVLESSLLLLPRELYKLIMLDQEEGLMQHRMQLLQKDDQLGEKKKEEEDKDFNDGKEKRKTRITTTTTKEKKKKQLYEWVLLSSHCTSLADPSSVGSNNTWKEVNVVPPQTSSSSSPFVPLEQMLQQQRKTANVHSQSDSLSSLISTSVTPTANSYRVTFRCPLSMDGFCCRVSSSSSSSSSLGLGGGDEEEDDKREILALRHPVSPLLSPPIQQKKPLTTKNNKEEEDDDNNDAFSESLPYLYHKTFSSSTSKSSSSSLKKTTNDDSVYQKLVSSSQQKFFGLSQQQHQTYHLPREELPYITTIRERFILDNHKTNNHDSTTSSEPSSTPNFFDILLQNDCLPSSKNCQKCLKMYEPTEDSSSSLSDAAAAESSIAGADCDRCSSECFCYCSILCKVRPPKKVVVKEFEVRSPLFRKDVERLVPRIIHQTWYEPVTKEKYPNMSRLIESWKKSGWEYNFYDDDSAAEFLSTHFPPEIREAYESITPGAFKADLFRYCVLLIRGGVYADMDVLLESNLDTAVANDVGFMTPIDEPGIKVNHRSCLWNGLIAVAPGHPFLAKTVEMVVNNIRNKFTSVDYDDMLCPKPVLSVSHRVDTLFTCGPCILGAGINALLGRHMQDQFEIGDVDIWHSERNAQNNDGGNVVVSPDDPRLLIPGRTIILQQNKEDMGAHRFTWVEQNIVVAATDMPDYDDRPPTVEHYSKVHDKAGIYGLKKLYTNNISADEEIRIVVKKA